MPIAFIFRVIIPAMHSGQDRAALALVFAWLVPMELLFGVMSVFSSTLSELVLDRESKLKAIQFMYGLQPSVYWCAWISYMAIISAVCSVIYAVAFFAVAPIFSESNKLIVFAIFVLGHLQVCAVSCLFSTFFNKVKTAATAGSLMLTVLNLLSLWANIQLQGKSYALFAGACAAIPGFGTFSALYALNILEAGPAGLNFSNFLVSEVHVMGTDQILYFFPPGLALILLLLSIAIFGTVAMYTDQVRFQASERR
jgi:hypothetical protein